LAARCPAAGGAAEDRGGEGVLRPGAGRRGIHHRRGRVRCHPAARRAGRAEHAARSARRAGVPGRPRPGGRVLPVAGRRRALHPGRRRRGALAEGGCRCRAHARPACRPGPAAGRLRDRGAVMTAAAPPLAPDLVAGLRRLKLAAIRQIAPELLITAKTQRWAPEELLRTLVEAEITAREASNARTRMKNAAFPVIKTLDELDQSVCSIPGPTLHYLASLEWIAAKENLCLVGPAGTGKSHVLISLGISAVHAGHKVRYFTAADLVDTLYRGLADNSAGKVIENLL